MLRYLRVRHVAIIDNVEVEFEPGFNVLTGETGAGKSILVEAVGLLLGGRATADLVRTGEETASVEAIFEHGGEEVVVRRELSSQGRSRAFIDGALAPATALKDLSVQLVELHGQHEHHTLLDPSTHLNVLDTFGRLSSTVSATATANAHAALIAARAAVDRVRTAARERATRLDLAAFQLAELERADLKDTQPPEDEELATLRQTLSSAERIERLCSESYASLYESDQAILAGLGGIWRRVGELASIDPRFRPYLDARDGIKSQLEDLALFLRRYSDTVDASPARLQQIEERLALLERLKRKYGADLRQVIAKREALRAEVAELESVEERLAELELEAASARSAYLSEAERLSAERKTAANTLARALEPALGELAMESSRFEVRFAARGSEEDWRADGIDAIEFYVSPNPGESLRPLARIVSGGELSRIMLAIKTLTATSRQGFTDAAARTPSTAAPGLIFDEVDAGIGGRVADVVGRRLRQLGSAFQVLCITHLPQIAAHADAHFQIDKRVVAGRTSTSVRRLDADGRTEEIARMLGGDAVTDRVRASAREMIEERRGAKAKGESETRRKPARKN